MRIVTDSIQVGDKIYEASQTLYENGGEDAPSGTIDINSNGKHDVCNYETANVNVLMPKLKLQMKTVTRNREVVTPDEGYDGLSSVSVNVNNEQITLKNMPEIFQRNLNSYYLALNNDEILYSIAEGTSNGKSGLWHYRVSTGEWTQLIDVQSGYQYFYQISETKWMLGHYAYSILIYDHATNTAKQLYSDGLQHATQIDEDKWLVTTYMKNKILVYNSADDSYIESPITGNFGEAIHLSGVKWLVTSYGSNKTKVVIYNSEDDTTIQIGDSSNVKSDKVTQLTENKYRIDRYIYNIDDDSCSQLLPKVFEAMTKVGDTKWLCATSSNSTSDHGLFVYNSEDDSCTQIYTTGRYLTNHQRVSETKCLITGLYNYDDSKGIFLYNSNDDSVVRIYEETSSSSYLWNVFTKVTDNKYIITSDGSTSSAYGLLLYNITDDSCVKIYSNGKGHKHWYQLNETEWLFYQGKNSTSSSPSTRTIYLYNSETNTVTSTINGVLDNIDIRIVKDGDDLYVVGTKNEFKLKFNESDKKFDIVEYGVGV